MTLEQLQVVPLIIAIIEVCKRVPGFPSWAAAPLAMILGIVASVLWEGTDSTHTPREWYVTVVQGLVYGLTAAGVYSGGRAMWRAYRGRD